MSMRAIRTRVRSRMAELEMSQRDLASKAGLDASTVSRILGGGVARVRPQTLSRIARALDLPPDELTQRVELEAGLSTVRFQLDPEAAEYLAFAAEQLGISQANLVRGVMEQWMERTRVLKADGEGTSEGEDSQHGSASTVIEVRPQE